MLDLPAEETYTDGTLEVTDGTDSVFGGYEWDGQAGLIMAKE